jgi:hypothetical protein
MSEEAKDYVLEQIELGKASHPLVPALFIAEFRTLVDRVRQTLDVYEGEFVDVGWYPAEHIRAHSFGRIDVRGRPIWIGIPILAKLKRGRLVTKTISESGNRTRTFLVIER